MLEPLSWKPQIFGLLYHQIELPPQDGNLGHERLLLLGIFAQRHAVVLQDLRAETSLGWWRQFEMIGHELPFQTWCLGLPWRCRCLRRCGWLRAAIALEAGLIGIWLVLEAMATGVVLLNTQGYVRFGLFIIKTRYLWSWSYTSLKLLLWCFPSGKRCSPHWAMVTMPWGWRIGAWLGLT